MIKKVMIKETYCSYEVSKLLKEKGMDKEYFTHYIQKNNTDGTSEAVTTCTHQMAMAWLREEKNIFISICNGNHCKLDKNISSETVYYFFSITNSYGVYKEEEQCFDEFKTYEEAVEAAVKYCLENLI